MKRSLLVFFLIPLLLCLGIYEDAQAQSRREISGVVYDATTGETIPGVVVIEDGTSNGVITDTNGKYHIVLHSVQANLKFTCLGFTPQTVNPKSAVCDVRLKVESAMLDDVVVTALGITRKEKSLGYSVAKVSTDDIDNAGSGNWLSGVSGKVAGLNIEQNSSGPDGSLRVTLRGESSLSYENNSVLFVVDGVPVNTPQASNASGSGYQNNDAPVDFGGGSVDINPDDIESMSVLKGSAATALYGSRAANGAIVITTKKAEKYKGVGVTYNLGMSWEQAGFWPEIQTEYGAGDYRLSTLADHMTDGVIDEISFYNVPADKSDTGKEIKAFSSRYQFGEKVQGQMRYMFSSYNPETGEYTRKPYEVYNHLKEFFQTGFNLTNGVTVNASSAKGASVRVSLKDVRNNWIVPNTGYSSQTFGLNASTGARKYVEAKLSATYYRKDSDNLPMGGYNDGGIMKSLLWANSMASGADLYNEYLNGNIEKYWSGSDSKVRLINASNDNPYFIAYKHLNKMDRDRIYGNASVTAHIIPGELDLMIRGAMNMQNDLRSQQRPQYSRASTRGMYREQKYYFLETNIDFLLSWHRKIAKSWQLGASFGGNMMMQKRNNVNLYAAQLLEPNIFIIQNVNGQLSVTDNTYQKAVNSLYGFINCSYKDMVFLEITGRNDWSSTLAPGHNSYFYPSVNTSVLLDKVTGLSKRTKAVDMIKFYASWANVGNDTDPYRILSEYNNSTRFTGSYSIPSVTPDYFLKPENVESIEVGLETSFFKHRLGFDVTFYNTETTNQIINLPQDWASGASATLTNAGRVRNRGWELTLHAMPIDKRYIKWTIDVNWSTNQNTLVELAPGVNSWQMSSLVGGKVIVYGFPGQDMGRIYGPGIEKAPEGAFYLDAQGNPVDCSGMDIVNADTGNPVRSSDPKDLGSIYPKWTGGLSTTFRYRSISLSASFSASFGGKAYSVTNAILSYMGKTPSTLPGRYGGLVHEGVNLNPDGTYSLNTTKTTDIVEYYNMYLYNRDNIENNVFDTSYLKLKELRLTYTLPRKYCVKSKVFQNASISVFATNVFCITKWPQFNPDVASLSGSSLYAGAETGAMPMTRCYGLNLKLGF